MEQLTVFYRIFHADLSPTRAPSVDQRKEYKEFLNHYDNMPGYPIPENVSLLPDHLLRFYYYKVLLHKLVKEIEAGLYQNVFIHGKNERKMRSEVIKLQRYINLNLITIRKDFIPPERQQHMLQFSEAKDQVDIYKLAYSSLVDLHDYLEATFRHYLDEHIVVPCKKRKCFIEEQRPKAECALIAIEHYDIPPKLKQQVGGTIQRFLSDGFNGFTYAQMYYCSQLNKKLNEFFNSNVPTNEDKFICMLIQINFNRNGVFHYILNFVKDQLKKKETCCEQLELLSYYLKSVNRIQDTSGFAYNEKLRSLKEQLVVWLEQKIDATSVKNIEVTDPLAVFSKKPALPVEKYKVNFSVPESALFLRIIKETNIVDMSRKELFDHFTTYFNTKQSHNVSFGSLDKGYYEPSEKNLRIVREALQQCVSHLDELTTKLYN